jgi:hypothetical protein
MKLSLNTYQQLDAITADPGLSALDKSLFSVCAFYNLTEAQLDAMEPHKVLHMAQTVTKTFSTDIHLRAPTRVSWYKFTYDMSKLTFGQYVELVFFFKSNLVDKAHYVAATVAKTLVEQRHPEKAAYFLKCRADVVLGIAHKVKENFDAFNQQYKFLFRGEGDEDVSAMTEWFNQNFGWTFSAAMVAEHERVTLDEAYELPVTQALNALAYIRAKHKYLKYLSKQR